MIFKTKVLSFFITLLLLSFVVSSHAQGLDELNGQFSPSLFKKGATWTWSYYESGDLNKVYSEEKYKVIKKKGSMVTFILFSKVGQEEKFSKRGISKESLLLLTYLVIFIKAQETLTYLAVIS